jgi:hypothetical protein
MHVQHLAPPVSWVDGGAQGKRKFLSDTGPVVRPLWLSARLGKLALRRMPSQLLPPPEMSAALRAQTPVDRRAHARRGLERLSAEEGALAQAGTGKDDQESVWRRIQLLGALVRLALLAEDYDATRTHAKRYLTLAADAFPSDPRASEDFLGEAIYPCHQALGHAAFATGDTDAAEVHLLESVRFRRAPVTLRSFGPSMSLARRLLESGRTDSVISYLKTCQAFWNRKLLVRWVAEIESGAQPMLCTPGDVLHD